MSSSKTRRIDFYSTFSILERFGRVFAKSMSLLPQDSEVRLVLEVLFPKSSIETRALKCRKGKFFEEQNALEMILGCFLDPFFIWEGEATSEFCSEGGLLTQCSKIPL